QIAKACWMFACAQVSGSNDNDRRLTPYSPVDLRHWITHPELTTDERRFGYSGFKRKVSFFRLDGPSMPDPDLIQVFHCPSGVESAERRRESVALQAIRLHA